jgi:hypothetical protein
MSLVEIMAAIEAADPGAKVALAEELMAGYTGEDKPLVEPDVMELAFVASHADGPPLI